MPESTAIRGDHSSVIVDDSPWHRSLDPQYEQFEKRITVAVSAMDESTANSQGSTSVSDGNNRTRTSSLAMLPQGDHTPSDTDLRSAPSTTTHDDHVATTSDNQLEAGSLEAFLVNFVVEQTGYPPEVVELDADLESDLGIDSIKKAQLFGELQEYFDVTPSEDLTLDDFPTLRHVVDFLMAEGRQPPVREEPSMPITDDRQPASESAEEDSLNRPGDSSHARSTARDTIQVPTLMLSGTPYEMGLEHGRRLKEQILRPLRRIADLTMGDTTELPMTRWSDSLPEEIFSEDELSELQGIADAIKVPVGNVIAFNLTLLADLGSQSVQLGIALPGTAVRVRQGVRDELTLNSALAACLQPVVQVRTPDAGHAHATVTFAGSICALAGTNANGLSATAGLILPDVNNSSSLPPRQFLLLRQVLAQVDDIDSSKRFLTQSRTSADWNMTLSDSRKQQLGYVESIGGSVASQESMELFAANHSLLHPTATHPAANASHERLKRITQFCTGSSHTIADMQFALTSFGASSENIVSILIDREEGDLWTYFGGSSVADNIGFRRFRLKDYLEPTSTGQPKRISSEPTEPTRRTPIDISDLSAEFDTRSTTMRFVMRLIYEPWSPDAPRTPTFNGPVLIVGENSDAYALRDRLSGFGIAVHQLPTPHDLDEAIGSLEQLWERQPTPHLFLVSARDRNWDESQDAAHWDRTYQTHVLNTYFLCQRWLQLVQQTGMVDQSTIVAATNLGGDFGFSGDVRYPESGALVGLLKAMLLEFGVVGGHESFLAKAIDSASDEPPAALAEFICRELASRTRDYEVACAGGLRHLQIAIPVEADLNSPANIKLEGTWVVTGGARGITAICARELGRRFQLKVHLIGTTAEPSLDPKWRALDDEGLAQLRTDTIRMAVQAGEKPDQAWERILKSIEIDRTLTELRAEGIQATYHACDVADRASLERVLSNIRTLDGPISGILHGAGIDRSCRFERKTRQDVEETFAAKALGAYNLMVLTNDDPIRHFIGFGSVSGRLGSNGQTDYCAASDLLCKLVSWYGRQNATCQAITFQWHPWADVGMACRPETQANLAANRLNMMPTKEGLWHFLRELLTGGFEREVLITEWDYHQRFYPSHVKELASQYAEGKRPSFPGKMQEPICERLVMRMVDMPLDTGCVSPDRLPNRALILGDNDDALALCDQLREHGVMVEVIDSGGDADHLITRLEKLWTGGPIDGLFLMTSRDIDAAQSFDRSAFQRRSADGIHAPIFLTQRWCQLIREADFADQATLVAATSLGGGFGFGTHVNAAEGGALCGLLKSVHVENSRGNGPTFRVKLIDSPVNEDSRELASAICLELGSQQAEVEVGWSAGQRKAVRCCPEPTDSLSRRDLPHGGTWVVTGGGRGITAFAAFHLARRYGLRLHVIGKTPLPRQDAPWLHCSDDQLKQIKAKIVSQAIAEGRSPEEEWGQVRKSRELADCLGKYDEGGIQAVYHACDVSDWEALGRVLDEIRQADGPIEGILHGAGYAKAGRFESLDRRSLERTFAPKVDGALALMTLTRQDPLRCFVAFGSLSGRFGGNGLSDYAAANDALAKLCVWFRDQRPDCATSCIHWQTWDRIGMAMVADAVDINKNALNMAFMPPEEGELHLREELHTGLTQPEVLITDGYFQRIFYANKTNGDAEDAALPANQLGRRPLIEDVERGKNRDAWTANVLYRPDSDCFLREHLLKGKPFLPAVVELETILQAAAVSVDQDELFQIHDVDIVNGMLFSTQAAKRVRVNLHRGDGELECALVSELHTRDGRLVSSERPHVTARVPLDTKIPMTGVEPLTEPPLGWHSFQYAEEALLYHGPVFRQLREFSCQYDGGWGRITVPSVKELAGDRAADGWILPLAVLDACLVCCGTFVFLQFGGQVEVPQGFGCLAWNGALTIGDSCTVRYYFRRREDRCSYFDFTLYAGDGNPVLRATDYRTVRLPGKEI